MTTYQIVISIDHLTVSSPAEVMQHIVTELSRLNRIGDTTLNSITIIS